MEAPTQAGGLLALVPFVDVGDGRSLFYFGGICAARFEQPVEPSDQLTLVVWLDVIAPSFSGFSAGCFVETQLAVWAELFDAPARLA